VADWTELDTNTLLPGEPLTSAKALAFFENPKAIAEGAASAPRIEDAALDTGAATASGVTWWGLRSAGAAAGSVGTYAFLTPVLENVAFSFGDTTAGSGLRPSNASGFVGFATLAGTWRCMGQTVDTSQSGRAAVFLRIS
jgi:hypothetical protein